MYNLWLDVERKLYSYAPKDGYSRYPYDTESVARHIVNMLEAEGYREDKKAS
jgi:hypothetical protein